MEKQRLLIIGARGFLGTYAVRAASEKFDVIRGGRSATNETGSVKVDIRDPASVEAAFRTTRPDGVLLLAAISDIDRCEAEPEQAFASNARGAENVANACARDGTRLLFASTAAVFDGKKHGYTEEDEISPLSVYGKTKVWAENVVKSLTPSAVILRFALVLGFAQHSGTNAMLDNLLAKWKLGLVVPLPTRELRNPVDAGSLGKTMVELLADRTISGLFHVGSSDAVSRYELGKQLAVRAGYSADFVLSQESPAANRAPRGEDHFLLTDKIRNVYSFELISTQQVIERCFS